MDKTLTLRMTSRPTYTRTTSINTSCPSYASCDTFATFGSHVHGPRDHSVSAARFAELVEQVQRSKSDTAWLSGRFNSYQPWGRTENMGKPTQSISLTRL